MPDLLNQTIALAKQAYDELMGIIPLTMLEQREFGEDLKRQRIADLLKKLDTTISVIQRIFADQVAASETLAISIPPTHRDFYNEVVLSKGKFFQRAYFEISGLSMLVGLLDDPTDEKPKPLRLNAISWGLERWNDMLDEEEKFEWYERGFNIDGAQELVALPWFKPDEWSQNFKLLQPVLVDRPLKVMRDHVHYRLTEIYRAFTHGLWMAAIALSRSLVEFSLGANASRLNISIKFTGKSGRLEYKTLKQLGEEIAVQVPALAVPIEIVRETGNRILHPKKDNVIAHPKVMRSEALECVKAAQFIVEMLYSEDAPEK